MLKTLELTNFKIHRRRTFSFTSGVNSISGRSGTGKTAIIEALGILFNNYNGVHSDYITTGEDYAIIKAEFDDIVVERKIGNGSYFKIEQNGQILAQNLTAGVKYLKGIFDITKFDGLVYIPQDSITSIFLLNKSDRIKLFDRLLGLDNYNKLDITLTEIASDLKVKQANLNGRLEILRNQTNLIELQTSLNDELAGLKAQATILSDSAKDKQEKLSQVSKDRARLIELDKDIIRLHERLTSVRVCPNCGLPLLPEEEYLRLTQEHQDKLNQRELLEYSLADPIFGEVETIHLQLSNLRAKASVLIAKGNEAKQKLAEAQGELDTVESQSIVIKNKIDLITRLRNYIPKVIRYVISATRETVSSQATAYLDAVIDYADVEVTVTDEFSIEVKFDGELRKFHQLSGGQKVLAALSVRLALFKAISNSPLLILDEPNSNLDDLTKGLLVELINNINLANQIIVITHDQTFAGMLDNTIIL